MSTKTLKNLLITMIGIEKFTFPHHLTNGVMNGEDIISKLGIVETQYFPTNIPHDEAVMQFTYATQQGYGSNILDMAKELIHRHKWDETALIGMIYQCFITEGIMDKPEMQPFLKGTPKLQRGSDGKARAKTFEDIKRHFSSFRSMKNKPRTRLARKRSIISLMQLARWDQEELLKTVFPEHTVTMLGMLVDGWVRFVDMLGEIQKDITGKQNFINNGAKEMHTAMKDMYNGSAQAQHEVKPIHFLGRDHYQAEVMPVPTTGPQAAGFVWALYDAPYGNDEDRKRAYQRVMSYIHRLSANHQQHILASMNIKEKDPRQAGLLVTKLLQERIMGVKEEQKVKEVKVSKAVDVQEARLLIEFSKEFSGYPFSKENSILKNPEEAVAKFFQFFHDGVTDAKQISVNIKMVCGFFEHAAYEVKVAVLTRVFRIDYSALTPDQLGREIIKHTNEWLYKGYLRKVDAKRNTFQPQQLQGINVNATNKPTAIIVDGDFPDIADQLQRMFVNGGMSVSRPQASPMAMGPTTNMTYDCAPKLEKSVKHKNAIDQLVDAWMALNNIDDRTPGYETVREQLTKKAKDTYKPKLGVINREEQIVYRFEGLDVNGELFTTVSLTFTPNGSDAVYRYQHVDNGIVGKIAHIQCNHEVAIGIFEELKRAYRDGCKDLRKVVHHAAQSTASRIYS